MTYTHIKRWTMPDHYFGAEWPNYYSSGCGQSRDSDCLERSNFAVMLQELGGESDTIIVVRESHWAVGWVEWIAIHESNTAALETADKLQAKLEDYPILDECDFSKRETEEANQVWINCFSPQERIDYIRKYRSQFDFNDFRDMLACARGEYFLGYASELIN